MTKTFYVALASALLAAAPLASMAAPNLVVHPTRVVLEKNDRNAQLELTNTGDQPGVYSITLENRRMDEDGRFTTVKSAEPGELFATDIVQYSPRRVELAPGSGQTIRIAVRKPPNLAPGEYRSHLVLSRVPDAKPISEPTQKPGATEIGIVLTPLVGVSIPVIVRHGETSASAKIAKATFIPAVKSEPALVSVRLEREGNQSAYGDLSATLIGADGKEKTLATSSGVAIYSPNKTRTMKLVLRTEDEGTAIHGRLHVVFRDSGAPSGKVQSETDLTVP